MLRFSCFFLSLIICDVMPLLASQNYLPTMLSENVDKKYAEHNKFFLKSDRSNNVIHSGDVKVGHLKFTVSKNNINYDAQNLEKKEESKSTFYYTVPVQAKSFLSRFFIGNHFSARMDTFQNAEIPFLARGSGVSTEVSTQSTNFSASYFKSNTRNSEKNSAYLSLQREKQTLAGDTKLALAIPFMSQLKLFGGYSYNRSETFASA